MRRPGTGRAPAARMRSAIAKACSRVSIAQGACGRRRRLCHRRSLRPRVWGRKQLCFSCLTSRLTSLYGLLTGMHSTTPSNDFSEAVSTALLLPVMPMAVRAAPGIGCARNPSDSIRSQTARTCSSVALDCITISITVPPNKARIRINESGVAKKQRQKRQGMSHLEARGGIQLPIKVLQTFADHLATAPFLKQSNHSIAAVRDSSRFGRAARQAVRRIPPWPVRSSITRRRSGTWCRMPRGGFWMRAHFFEKGTGFTRRVRLRWPRRIRERADPG